MRTITVPKKYGYPTLDITVNGKEYTVKSGEEITVEDSVAEAIENAIALAPKIGVPRSKIARVAEGSLAELTEEDLAGISKIIAYAFYTCRSVERVTIPDGVENIENHSFYGCSKLETLEMANSVRSIGTNAFDWCARLVSVYLPETPPALANVNAFDNIKADCMFYCKTQASLDAYRKAENWSTLTGTHTFVVEP